MKSLLLQLTIVILAGASIACYDQRSQVCVAKGYNTGCQANLSGGGGSYEIVLNGSCTIYYVDQLYGSSCSQITDPQYVQCSAPATMYEYSDGGCAILINTEPGTFNAQCGPVQVCSNSTCP